jgi:sugar transferase (PEP-CTERM/EpsH1 system associated)
MKAQRVLIVSPSVPAPRASGFDRRVFHLARQLSKGRRITVVCYGDVRADNLDPVRAIADAVHVIAAPRALFGKRSAQLLAMASGSSYESGRLASAAMQAAVDRLLEPTAFDAVQITLAQMGWMDLSRAPAVILDAHNLEHEAIERLSHGERSRLRRAYNRIEARRFERFERRLYGRIDGCAVPSRREAEALSMVAPALAVRAVPNGVDLDEFVPQPPNDASANIVFTGTMNYRPNADAAVHLVRDILPLIHRRRPDVHVLICGMDPPREVRVLAGPRVEVTGWVADTRPYLASAAAIVVPLRSGGGTRLKVLEALAMSRPVVSTTLGCEGLEVTPETNVLLADDPESFAATVLRLLDHRRLGAELGRRGRELVEAAYSWDVAGAALDELYTQVLAAPRAA